MAQALFYTMEMGLLVFVSGMGNVGVLVVTGVPAPTIIRSNVDW